MLLHLKICNKIFEIVVFTYFQDTKIALELYLNLNGISWGLQPPPQKVNKFGQNDSLPGLILLSVCESAALASLFYYYCNDCED